MKIEIPLDRTARPQLQAVSDGVFGSKYLFETYLMLGRVHRGDTEISETVGQFYQTELAQTVGCAVSQVGAIVKRLRKSGLISEVVSDVGVTRNYYRPTPSPLWTFVEEWAEELLGTPRRGQVANLDEHR